MIYSNVLRRRARLLVAIAAAAFLIAPGPANAHEGLHGGAREKTLSGAEAAFPLLIVDGDVELRFDDFFASDAWENRRRDVNVHSEVLFGFHALPGLSLQGKLKAEAVREPKPGRDRFLSGTGVALEEFYVDYDSRYFGLYAGKFDPAFGLAWRKFGEFLKEGFAEEYELDEMIGIGGALKIDLGAAGRHEINAAMFFLDTSFLHRSLLAQPGAGEERAERISHLRRRDGGLANTGALNSFAIGVDGGDFDFLPGLSYHIGWRHLHRGLDQLHSEDALAVGLIYDVDFNGVGITAFAEIVRFWHFEGESGAGLALSVGLSAQYQRFTWQGGVTLRRAQVAAIDGPDVHDWMAGMQLVYDLGGNFGLGIGYRHQRVERVDTDQLRVFLAYQFGIKQSLGK